MEVDMNLTVPNIRSLISKRVSAAMIFFIIFYCVGIFGIADAATRNLFISLSPLALLLSLLAVFIFHQPVNLKKEAILFTAIYIAGFLIEVVGVNTGRLFGSYSYGDGLGIKLFNTPLLIGINWVLLVYCTSVITQKLAMPDVLKILISSSLMVLYDVIMEQVAPEMKMWSFTAGAAPARNYFTWFLLSIIFHSLLKLTGVKIVNRIAAFILFIQALFFIILTIFFKLAV